MTDYVLSPFYPVADKLDTSHRAGWARYWAKELGAELLTTKNMDHIESASRNDALYLYHGMEWQGAMNLQSGLTDEIVARAERLRATKAKIISLDRPMPLYGKLLEARGYEHGDSLDKKLGRHQMLAPNKRPKCIIMGDSHSLSLYRPGCVIYRADGQTLHGALEIGLAKRLDNWGFENDVVVDKLELLTSYFGNIDIRHHLLRQPDPKLAAKSLVTAYMKQLAEIQSEHRIKHIEVAVPLPIESEDRVLPKTGWYKGTPFFGSWAERTEIRNYMATRILAEAKKYGFSVYAHPKHFVNPQGELSFNVMEQPRSVHIRPSEYRLVQEKLGW